MCCDGSCLSSLFMLVLHLMQRWLLPLPSVQITSDHFRYFLSMPHTGGSFPAQIRFSMFLVVVSHWQLPSGAEGNVVLVSFNLSCRRITQTADSQASSPSCKSHVVFVHFNVRRQIVVSTCSSHRRACTHLEISWEIEGDRESGANILTIASIGSTKDRTS